MNPTIARQNPGVLPIVCKVLLEDLRDISRRVKSFADMPSENPLSGRLERFQKVADFVGFGGLVAYIVALYELALALETAGPNIPPTVLAGRVRALHEAIGTLGHGLRRLVEGHALPYRELNLGLRELKILIGDMAATVGVVYPSFELENPLPATDSGHQTQFKEGLKNVFGESSSPSAAKVFDLLNSLPPAGMKTALVIVGETLAIIKEMSLPETVAVPFMSAMHAYVNQQVSLAELMTTLLNEMEELVKGSAASNETYRSFAIRMGASVPLRGDPHVYKQYMDALTKFEAFWSKAAAADNVAIVAKHTASFARGAAVLNNPMFTKLAAGLNDATQAALSTSGPTYEFWVNGAIALLQMRAAVDTNNLADSNEEQHLADIVSEMLIGNRGISTTLPKSDYLTSLNEPVAIASVFQQIAEKAGEAEALIVEVLHKQSAHGTKGSPAALATTIGTKIAHLLEPVQGVLAFMGLPTAARAVQHITQQAKDEMSWEYDESAQVLFEALVALSLYATRIMVNDPQDMVEAVVLNNNQDGEDDYIVADTEVVAPEVEEPSRVRQEEAPTTPSAPVKASAGSLFIDLPTDEELLSVFLIEGLELTQEARHALADVVRTDNHAYREALLVVRRVFHTLKGSGRTVGLEQFGMAAESCQYALDSWTRDGIRFTGQDSTQTILEDFIQESLHQFEAWLHLMMETGFLKGQVSDLEHCIENARSITVSESAQNVAPVFEEILDFTVPLVEEGASQSAAEALALVAEEANTSVKLTADESLEFSIEPHVEVPLDATDLALVDLVAPFDESDCLVAAADELLAALKLAYKAETNNIDFAAQKELLNVFLSEALDNMSTIEGLMESLLTGSVSAEALEDLSRVVHGLKGALRTVGAQKEAALLHSLEDDLGLASPAVMDSERLGSYQYAFDLVSQQVSNIEARLNGSVPFEATEETGGVLATPESKSAAEDTNPFGIELTSLFDESTEQQDVEVPGNDVQDGLDQLSKVFNDLGNDKEPEIIESVPLNSDLDSEPPEHSEPNVVTIDEPPAIIVMEPPVYEMDASAAIEPAQASVDDTRPDGEQSVVKVPGIPEVIPSAVPYIVAPAIEAKAPEVMAPSVIPIAKAPTSAIRPTVAPGRGEQIRVPSGTLEQFGQKVGEGVVLQSRAQDELSDAWRGLRELASNVERLKELMKGLSLQAEIRMEAGTRVNSDTGFDALEMDRFSSLQELARLMAESIEDIQGSESTVSAALARLGETEFKKGTLSSELQREASNLMVVSFSSRRAKMQSTVRLAANDIQKQVEVEFIGDVELPGAVMAKLSPAIDHILRNAVAHGIELPAARRQARKPVTGKLTVKVSSTTEKTVIVISDDGAGINKDVVLAKAREKGLATNREYDEQDIYGFLFMNGFTTMAKASELAGRGVGLDAVKATLQEIGGEIFIRSTPGDGTEFRLEAPMDISSLSVVPVAADGFTCMIPSSLVERIVPLSAHEAAAGVEKGYIELEGKRFRYLRMGWLTAESSQPSRRTNVQLLLCGSEAGAPTAVEVDEIGAYRKVVVRPLGRHISGISGLIAGTTLADGSVALITNPLRMKVIGKDSAIKDSRPAVPLVMVVDDSSTVRLYTSKFLRREGYDVVEAKDGIEALDILRTAQPDIFLLDVEMPRMGGFELVSALREAPRFNSCPVVMITSRTSQKHRDHAARLGVQDYIGKPFEEQELLSVLNRYLKSAV